MVTLSELGRRRAIEDEESATMRRRIKALETALGKLLAYANLGLLPRADGEGFICQHCPAVSISNDVKKFTHHPLCAVEEAKQLLGRMSHDQRLQNCEGE